MLLLLAWERRARAEAPQPGKPTNPIHCNEMVRNWIALHTTLQLAIQLDRESHHHASERASERMATTLRDGRPYEEQERVEWQRVNNMRFHQCRSCRVLAVLAPGPWATTPRAITPARLGASSEKAGKVVVVVWIIISDLASYLAMSLAN